MGLLNLGSEQHWNDLWVKSSRKHFKVHGIESPEFSEISVI